MILLINYILLVRSWNEVNLELKFCELFSSSYSYYSLAFLFFYGSECQIEVVRTYFGCSHSRSNIIKAKLLHSSYTNGLLPSWIEVQNMR